MTNNQLLHRLITAILLSFTALNTSATTGYFALGYGAKSIGMAGAVVAAPQDAMVASKNPAGMGLIGERGDISVRIFRPVREAELDTSVVGANFKVNDRSDNELFAFGHFGITKQLTNDIWAGLTIYSNGGMNTTYSRNLYDETAAVLGAFAAGGPAAAALVPESTQTGTPDTGTLGVDLAQVIITPTLTFQVQPKHTLGVSLLLAVQRFEATGMGNFQCFTPTGAANNPAACAPGAAGPLTPGFVASDKLTNNGYEFSYGAGVRVGWIGQIHPQVTLGAAISSKVYMTEFDEYSELFAEDGGFDIPANVSAGIAFNPIPELTIAFDYERIFYGDVNSIANAGPIPTPAGPTVPSGSGLLGQNNGLGFGWNDINIYRLGVKYDWSPKLTLRAGYSYNDSPIPDDEILFNIVAPAVNKRHMTLGFSYASSNDSEWTFAYIHNFEEKQKTSQSAFGLPASIEMYQDSVELGYSWTF